MGHHIRFDSSRYQRARLAHANVLTLTRWGKVDRIVELTDLFEAGLAHMAAAEADANLPCRQRAAKFRDGLIVALLALRPVRLENLQAMTLGRQVIVRDDGVSFYFRPDELKWRTGPPLKFPLPDELGSGLIT